MNWKLINHAVRPVNLLLIFLSHVLVYFYLLKTQTFDFFYFCSIPVLLAAAAGYLANNFLDQAKDKFNGKPVLKPKKFGWLIYLTMVIASFCLAYFAGNKFFILTIMANLLLILYAKYFSGWMLTGNFVVSLLSAFSIVGFCVAGYLEFNTLALIIIGANIFIISMARELVKDAEDTAGDQAVGAKTFPIVLGLKWADRIIVLFLVVNVILLVGLAISFYFSGQILYFSICLFLLIFNILLCCYPLFNFEKNKKYYFWALGIKVFMAFGLLLIPVLADV